VPVLESITMLLQAGLGSPAAYQVAHVLLCLLPAFFVAGVWRIHGRQVLAHER
jgi:hypothetical protein